MCGGGGGGKGQEKGLCYTSETTHVSSFAEKTLQSCGPLMLSNEYDNVLKGPVSRRRGCATVVLCRGVLSPKGVWVRTQKLALPHQMRVCFWASGFPIPHPGPSTHHQYSTVGHPGEGPRTLNQQLCPQHSVCGRPWLQQVWRDCLPRMGPAHAPRNGLFSPEPAPIDIFQMAHKGKPCPKHPPAKHGHEPKEPTVSEN